MIEYQVISSGSPIGLTDRMNELSSSGWVMSKFGIAIAGSYGQEELYSAVMERENV